MMSTISDCRGTDTYTRQLVHHELSDIPAKQIHRWEGEGGFIPPEHNPRQRFTRRRRTSD